MSTILLFLFIFSAAREGLRDAWERQSDDHVAFDFGRLNVPALLATGVLGVWMWEIPDRTDWWHFPLALLVLSAALFGLCMLGTVLIHPERLGLASGPVRKAASSLQTLPVGSSRASGQQALVTVSQADQTLQIIGGPRRRLIAVLMLSVMVLLGIFGALLPVTGSLREHASLAMLLCIGMALVLLWEVLFRPWSVLKQHPNQEDGEVFCLLAIMAFFSSFIQLSPAPASDGMNLPMAATLALMLLMVLFMVASWVIKARRNWSRMTATLLYLGCLPYCLLVAATGQTPSPRPVPAMTAEQEQAELHRRIELRRAKMAAGAEKIPAMSATASTASSGLPAPVGQGAATSAIPAPAPDAAAGSVQVPVLSPAVQAASKASTVEPVVGKTPLKAGTAVLAGGSAPSGDGEVPVSVEEKLAGILVREIHAFRNQPEAVRVTRNGKGRLHIVLRPQIRFSTYRPESLLESAASTLNQTMHAVDREGVHVQSVDMHVWQTGHDKYGHEFPQEVLVLSLGNPVLSKVHWPGMSDEALLNIVKADWRPDGLSSAVVYCKEPRNLHQSSAFCAMTHRADVARRKKAARLGQIVVDFPSPAEREMMEGDDWR